MPDDPALGALYKAMNPEKYTAWLAGKIRKNGTGWVIECNRTHFDMLGHRFGLELNSALGKGKWRRSEVKR
ncbi:MAG: hypothetical protein GTO41_00830 [Burkholderiales bacterium]|nr:hypothetical protein [Burkholderiales bacterium]